jgi:hypothetical protein
MIKNVFEKFIKYIVNGVKRNFNVYSDINNYSICQFNNSNIKFDLNTSAILDNAKKFSMNPNSKVI